MFSNVFVIINRQLLKAQVVGFSLGHISPCVSHVLFYCMPYFIFTPPAIAKPLLPSNGFTKYVWPQVGFPFGMP